MRRLLAVVIGLLIVWFGLVQPSAAAVASPASPTPAWGYDIHGVSAQLDSTVTDRGPPAPYHHLRSAHDAVDLRSSGASARLDGTASELAITYDGTAGPMHVASAAATTEKRVEATKGGVCAVARSSVAAKAAIRVRPPLSIPKSQSGVKWGKHASDYGLDAGEAAARADWLSKVRNVHLNPDEVRVGQYGVYDDAFMFRQGRIC